MKIVRSGQLPYIPANHEDPRSPGVYIRVLYKKEELPAGNVPMINWAKLPAGQSFRPHYHQDMEEIFILMTGEAEIQVGKENALMRKGDAVSVPAGQIHRMTNRGAEEAEYLVLGISLGLGGKTVTVPIAQIPSEGFSG